MVYVAEKDGVRLTVDYELDAHNPRNDDYMLGTMICWHHNYELGEKHNYSDPEEFFISIATDAVIKHGLYDELADEYMKDYSIKRSDDGLWTIITDDLEISTHETREEAEDELEDIKDNLEIEEMLQVFGMEKIKEIIEMEYVLLPLYLYDHSGITMNTSGFSCSWDSGRVGWIYCSKDDFRKETNYSDEELFGTNKDRPLKLGTYVTVKGIDGEVGKVVGIDKGMVTVDFDYRLPEHFREDIVIVPKEDVEVLTERAKHILVEEVKLYDTYLRGEVFKYTIEKKKECKCCNNVTWEHIDSCGMFYGDDFMRNGMYYTIPKEYRHLVENLRLTL